MKILLTKLIIAQIMSLYGNTNYEDKSNDYINNSIREQVIGLPYYLKMNIPDNIDFEGYGYEDTVENVARYLAVELIKAKMDLN